MTTITITPERPDIFRAITGDKESIGRTAGEALDALTSQLGDDENGTLVVIQNHRADRFFSAGQQSRLLELTERDRTGSLSVEEREELESLIQLELDAARQRAEAMLNAPGE
jgi:hypothetical protein